MPLTLSKEFEHNIILTPNQHSFQGKRFTTCAIVLFYLIPLEFVESGNNITGMLFRSRNVSKQII